MIKLKNIDTNDQIKKYGYKVYNKIRKKQKKNKNKKINIYIYIYIYIKVYGKIKKYGYT